MHGDEDLSQQDAASFSEGGAAEPPPPDSAPTSGFGDFHAGFVPIDNPLNLTSNWTSDWSLPVRQPTDELKAVNARAFFALCFCVSMSDRATTTGFDDEIPTATNAEQEGKLLRELQQL